MKRSEILIIINIVLLIGICGISLLIWSSTIDSYDIIERNELNTTFTHFLSGINEQEEQILRQVRDYGWWDDTYRYIRGEYPEYVIDNFNEYTLENLNIQLLILIDAEGNIHNQTRLNSEIPLIPPSLEHDLLPLLIIGNENDQKNSLITLNQTTFLFSSVPILHTNTSGPLAGTIVFVRQVDDAFLSSLAKTVHYPVSLDTIPLNRNDNSLLKSDLTFFPSFHARITNEDLENIENSFSTVSSDNKTILTFSLVRPKTVAIQGREIIGKSLIILIFYALFYTLVMTLIILVAFSRYEKTRQQLENSNQEIRILAEKKKISDNIKKILDEFLRFKPDSRENIQQLISLSSEIMKGDCIIYSKIIHGIDTLIASYQVPVDYIHGKDPTGKISTNLMKSETRNITLIESLQESEFRDSDPLARQFGYQTYYGCRINVRDGNNGILSIYYRDAYTPGDLDREILHLIASALVVEEARSYSQIALQRRDSILESVSQAATTLINQVTTPDFHAIFKMLGEIISVSRVYIKVPPHKGTELSSDPHYQPWLNPETVFQDLPLIPFYSEWDNKYSGWLSMLKSGECIAGTTNSFSGYEREFLITYGVESLAIFPFFKKSELYGILVFEDLNKPREWIIPECKALKTAAALIGSTMERIEIEDLNTFYTLQLTEKSHELARMNVDIQERSYLIERLLDRKNELITQIGHDIRTPLTPIIGLIPLVKNDVTNANTLSMLDLIETGANRIKLLLDKILMLRLMESLNTSEEYGRTDVYSIVQMVHTKYSDYIQNKRILFTNTIQKEMFANIPDNSLSMVLEELMSNALRFTPDKGTIRFEAEEDTNSITVYVSDNGIGLSSEDIERIFDVFYKADSARHSIDTHGLGLPIVKQMIEKYQGTIAVTSKGSEHGVTVILTLPIKK